MLLILILAVWGATHLLGALRTREAPASRQARLLAGLCGVLLALALLTIGTGRLPLILLLAGAGIGCGAGWLYIIGKQSLHNTTM